MTLYFVNGSRQKKKNIESDYAEDIYDSILDFFESHGHLPHFLELMQSDKDAVITFESNCEHFLVEDAEEDCAELAAYIERFPEEI